MRPSVPRAAAVPLTSGPATKPGVSRPEPLAAGRAQTDALAGAAAPLAALAGLAAGVGGSRQAAARRRLSAQRVVPEDEQEAPAVEDKAPPRAPPPQPETTKPFMPQEQVGVTAPLGFFDPLGFCPPGDEGAFRKLRSAEIKHGRVAMLASIGAVFEHFFKFPFLGMNFQKGGIAATYTLPANQIFVGLLALAGIVELFFWKEDPNKEPGDFGDPAGFTKMFPYDQEMRNRELNNGRMAMFTAIGILAGDLATGKDAVEQLGL